MSDNLWWDGYWDLVKIRSKGTAFILAYIGLQLLFLKFIKLAPLKIYPQYLEKAVHLRKAHMTHSKVMIRQYLRYGTVQRGIMFNAVFAFL